MKEIRSDITNLVRGMATFHIRVIQSLADVSLEKWHEGYVKKCSWETELQYRGNKLRVVLIDQHPNIHLKISGEGELFEETFPSDDDNAEYKELRFLYDTIDSFFIYEKNESGSA